MLVDCTFNSRKRDNLKYNESDSVDYTYRKASINSYIHDEKD